MKRLIIGLGLVFLALLVYYYSYRDSHEEPPRYLVYSLGIAASLFMGLLLYSLLQYFKKK